MWLHISTRTTVMFLDIIHHNTFIWNTEFLRLDSVSIFRWNLLNWAQLIELVISLMLFWIKTGKWIMPRNTTVVLIYHHYKHLGLSHIIFSSWSNKCKQFYQVGQHFQFIVYNILLEERDIWLTLKKLLQEKSQKLINISRILAVGIAQLVENGYRLENWGFRVWVLVG
jgi:hypothetical protein